MSGSGISWAICKSAPRSRQITTPVPHHSVFTGRMPFLLPNQQHQSTEGTVVVVGRKPCNQLQKGSMAKHLVPVTQYEVADDRPLLLPHTYRSKNKHHQCKINEIRCLVTVTPLLAHYGLIILYFTSRWMQIIYRKYIHRKWNVVWSIIFLSMFCNNICII